MMKDKNGKFIPNPKYIENDFLYIDQYFYRNESLYDEKFSPIIKPDNIDRVPYVFSLFKSSITKQSILTLIHIFVVCNIQNIHLLSYSNSSDSFDNPFADNLKEGNIRNNYNLFNVFSIIYAHLLGNDKNEYDNLDKKVILNSVIQTMYINFKQYSHILSENSLDLSNADNRILQQFNNILDHLYKESISEMEHILNFCYFLHITNKTFYRFHES